MTGSSDSVVGQHLYRYAYKPLPEGQWFRLIHLMPGKFDDPIHIKLVKMHIEEALSYETISYCWGDSRQRVQIYCGDQAILVTVNLSQALRRFRLKNDVRFIWTDAICIDQNSKLERGRQVAFMGRIYTSGSCTLVWLGEETEGVDTAGGIQLMHDFNRHMQSVIDRTDKSIHKNIWDSIYSIPALPEDHVLLSDAKKWNGLRDLVERPWFTRLWVLQEVGLSRRAIAFCGNYSVEFGEIVLFSLYRSHMGKFLERIRAMPWNRIYYALGSIWSTFGIQDSWMNDGGTLEKVKDYFQAQCKPGLLDVLETSREFAATEDIDHIFALMGHPLAKSEDGLANIVEPDYMMSTDEATLLLARKICHVIRSPRLLCWVQNWSDEEVESLARPSWVPTWHQGSLYPDRIYTQRFPDASLAADMADRIIAIVDGGKLRVAALLLDSINSTTNPLSACFEDASLVVEECWKLYSSSEETVKSDPYYWHNFLWTLVRSYPVPDSLVSDFVAFCRAKCSSDFTQLVINHPYFTNALIPSTQTTFHRFVDRVTGFCANRRFFTTKRGTCGMSLRPSRQCDVLAIILGCPMPILLRPTRDVDQYWLTCQAFVNGMMYGEAIEKLKQQGSLYIGIKEITLV